MRPFTYFAYGSNMLTGRLQQRCGTARVLGPATAAGYAIQFSKKGRDGSGKASIRKTGARGAIVYGVLFEIDMSEKAVLDSFEDHPRGYKRHDSFIVETADARRRLEVSTYIVADNAIDECLKPFDWYLALIIAGGTQHQLPDDYLKALMKSECIQDPDHDNRKKAFKLLKTVATGPMRRGGHTNEPAETSQPEAACLSD
jgi:gamma-glutamylcyclotransferase (GGCT)/AIG2-like uncharacterized protein YtfP